MHAPIKVLLATLLLTGCMEDVGPDQTSAKPVAAASSEPDFSLQAFKAHKVAEAVDGFNAICLDPSPTFNRVKSEAISRGFGVREIDYQDRAGTPFVTYIGYDAKGNRAFVRSWSRESNSSDVVHADYVCSIGFRGMWASVVLEDIQGHLRKAGYRFVTPLKQSSRTLSSGQTIISYDGIVQKNGKRAMVAILQADGTRKQRGDVTTLFISGTLIKIATRIPPG